MRKRKISNSIERNMPKRKESTNYAKHKNPWYYENNKAKRKRDYTGENKN